MRTRPDQLRQIDLPSGRVTVDEHGYLTDPALWSEDFAEHTARAEGLGLTSAHWQVIRFIRDWEEEHSLMPDARFAMADLGQREGLTKSGAKTRMFELFPYGYVRQACKIAGMRQPRAWSTG